MKKKKKRTESDFKSQGARTITLNSAQNLWNEEQFPLMNFLGFVTSLFPSGLNWFS